MTIVAMILGLFALILVNVPIAVALGVVAAIAMLITQGAESLLNLGIVLFTGATSFPLIAIPLFILAGAIMNASGISQRMIAFAGALFGFVRGGLAMVTVGANMFFAEISGSAVADVAATGSILIPAMKKKGYTPAMAAAVTSSAASLAVIIPPSIPMILYAAMANTSVVQLFLAGVVPGVLGGFGLMACSYYLAVRYNLPREAAFDLCVLWKAFKDAFWALFLPIIILGGIFGGVVTATEGAALAVVAALFIGLVIYRELDVEALGEAITEGGIQTATVMLLVATSAVLGVYLTEARLPQELAQGVLALTENKYMVLLLLNVFFLIIGLFLHSAAAIILVIPVVMPLVQQVGIDPVHFGLVVTLNLAIGQQTPPVASVLVVASAIAKEDIWRVTRVNLWYISVLVGVLLLVTYVPAIPLAPVEYFYR